MKEKFCGGIDTCIETLQELPCGMQLKENITKAEIEEIQSHIKSESQVLSSVVLACLIVVGLFFICLSRITQENLNDQPNSHRRGDTSNQLQQIEAPEQTLNDQSETEA
ncbi:unnamed protein product [Staurois parvus]|uniref:Uncharacterized protein n=1 Tax=Staurois parvus TaxID=386267 RepID=A0ABN9ES08_9NEOB|nr:unnamed protein product [Staurois parvus]